MEIKLNRVNVYRSTFCGLSSDAKAAYLGLLATSDSEGLVDFDFVCRNFNLPNIESLRTELETAGIIIVLNNEIVAIKQWPAIRFRNYKRSKSAYPSLRKRLKVRDDEYYQDDETV